MVASCVGSLHAIALSLQNSLSSNDVCVRVSSVQTGYDYTEEEDKRGSNEIFEEEEEVERCKWCHVLLRREDHTTWSISHIQTKRKSTSGLDWTGQTSLPNAYRHLFLTSFLPST